MTEKTTLTIPVDPSYTELGDAIGHLTTEQIRNLASYMLSYAQVPHSTWSAEDIASHFEEVEVGGVNLYHYSGIDYTLEERDALVDGAQDSRYWRDIGDSTEQQYMAVDMAIDDAVASFAS